MLQHLLRPLPDQTPQATGEHYRHAPLEDDPREEIESIERTLRYVGRQISVAELGKAVQISVTRLRKHILLMTADGKVAYDGRFVRLLS